MKSSQLVAFGTLLSIALALTFPKTTFAELKIRDDPSWSKDVSVYDFTCTNEATEWASVGDGKADRRKSIFLDRQDVSCTDKGAISGYRLIYNDDRSLARYQVRCCTGSWLEAAKNKTIKSDITGLESWELDKAKISCSDTNYPALLSFKLERVGSTSVRYSYVCAWAKVKDGKQEFISPNGSIRRDYVSNMEWTDLWEMKPWCDTSAGQIMTESRVYRGKREEQLFADIYYWKQAVVCREVVPSVIADTSLDNKWFYIKNKGRCMRAIKSGGTAFADAFYADLQWTECGPGAGWLASPIKYACPSKPGSIGGCLAHVFKTKVGGEEFQLTLELDGLNRDRTPSKDATFRIRACKINACRPYYKGIVYEKDYGSFRFAAMKSLGDWYGSVPGYGLSRQPFQLADATPYIMDAEFRGIPESTSQGKDTTFTLEKIDAAPEVIKNFGNICSKKGTAYVWPEASCPFMEVTGVGSTIGGAPQISLGSSLNNMLTVETLVVYTDDDGILGMKMEYNNGDVKFAPDSTNFRGAKLSTCTLAENEFVEEMRMITGNGDGLERPIAGFRWKLSTGRFCTFPSSEQPNSLRWSSGYSVDVGSGNPYGAVFVMQGKYLASLGFVFYDTVVAIETQSNWDLEIARRSLTLQPKNVASQKCIVGPNGVETQCSLDQTDSVTESTAVQNAFTTSNQYARQYAKKLSFGQSIKVGIKFKVPLLTEVSSEIGVTFGQETSDQETWTSSEQQQKSQTYTTSKSFTIKCGSGYKVLPGQTCSVLGTYSVGKFDSPWKGTTTYVMKGGARFVHAAEGVFKEVAVSACESKLSCDAPTAKPPPPALVNSPPPALVNPPPPTPVNPPPNNPPPSAPGPS